MCRVLLLLSISSNSSLIKTPPNGARTPSRQAMSCPCTCLPPLQVASVGRTSLQVSSLRDFLLLSQELLEKTARFRSEVHNLNLSGLTDLLGMRGTSRKWLSLKHCVLQSHETIVLHYLGFRSVAIFIICCDSITLSN